MNINMLLPINKAAFDDQQVNAVSGRALHTFLGIGKDFSTWMKDQITSFEFQEHLDFETYSPISGNIGQPKIEYLLSIPMAKELSMVSRTGKGKEARLYFIECEKKALMPLNTFKMPSTVLEAGKLWIAALEENKVLTEALTAAKPAQDFYESIICSDTAVSVEVFAKAVGIGRNKLFKILRDGNFLIKSSNLPYQTWLKQKLFEVDETVANKIIFATTKITGKGQDYLVPWLRQNKFI